MPGLLDDTHEIMHWTRRTLAGHLRQCHGPNTIPPIRRRRCRVSPQINRHLHAGEFEEALEAAKAAGLWRLDTRWRK